MENKSKFKSIMAGVAIFLACVLTLGVVVSLGYNAGWFKKNEVIDSTTEDGSNLIVSDTTNNGIQLLSTQLTPTDDGTNSCTITATIEPSTATDQTVTMSLAWADSTSDWASGKTVTDYCTITQDSTGSLTGTLACSQAFGEQIILTVTSNSDSSVYATATLDYVKRVSSFALTVTNSTTGSTVTSLNLGERLSVSAGAVLGTGTIIGEIEFSDLYYGIDTSTYSMGMMASTWASNYSMYSHAISSVDYITNGNTDSTSISMSTGYNSTSDTYYIGYSVPITSLSQFVSNYDDLSDSALTYLNNYTTSGSTWWIILGMSYTYSYNGVTYGSGSAVSSSWEMTIPASAVAATAVTLEDDSYIF